MGFGAILGGVASIGGALLGAAGASKANKQNREIANQNFELDKRALDLAERQYEDSLKGFSDSFGNSSYYDPIRGWVSQSPPSSIDRRNAESGAADQFLAELTSVGRRDPEVIRRERDLAATAGFNTGFDDASNSALISAMRAGPGTLGSVGSQLAESRGTALADILQRNAAGSYSDSFGEQAAARGPIADLYTTIAGRAEGRNNVPSTAFSAQQGLNSASIASNANANTERPFVAPNNAFATALSTVGNTIGSGFANYEAQQQQTAINNAFIESLRNRTAGNQT